jgi:hypothetical protein
MPNTLATSSSSPSVGMRSPSQANPSSPRAAARSEIVAASAVRLPSTYDAASTITGQSCHAAITR